MPGRQAGFGSWFLFCLVACMCLETAASLRFIGFEPGTFRHIFPQNQSKLDATRRQGGGEGDEGHTLQSCSWTGRPSNAMRTRAACRTVQTSTRAACWAVQTSTCSEELLQKAERREREEEAGNLTRRPQQPNPCQSSKPNRNRLLVKN